MAKLSKEQEAELAQWKKERAKKYLHDLPDRVEKDVLQSRLNAWGIVFLLVGITTLGLGFVAGRILPMLFGAATAVVGFIDLQKKTITMLRITGFFGFINGIVLLLFGGIFWGMLMMMLATFVLIDAGKAAKKIRAAATPKEAAEPTPANKGESA